MNTMLRYKKEDLLKSNILCHFQIENGISYLRVVTIIYFTGDSRYFPI